MQNESDVFISPKDSLDIIKKILAILIYQKNKLKKILEQSKEENDNKKHLQFDYINLQVRIL